MYKIIIFVLYEKIIHLLFMTNVVYNLLFAAWLIFSHKCRL
jgi:hypothetical protein